MSEIERRREARRRKILQNTENRLSRISSVEHKTCWGSNVETVEEALPELLPQSFNCEMFAKSPIITERTPISTQQKRPHRCIIIFGLAVFMHFLRLFLDGFLKLNMNETFNDMIFLPVFLFEVSEVIGGRPNQSNVYMEYLLTFAAGNKTFGRVAAQYLGLISSVLQDVMVYFFFYVWCHIGENMVLAAMKLR